ncbi:uncharacterized protein [Physcomitrium patens]|uniref:Uncharacterized protein n=1 Tax=Physcomitrium patens TaxID=3218 RepID=A9TQB2_PHYPA|nr:uncharacterized protein LOC112281545 [Physcomitrium patens]XP_024373965.1 uncharacterized protein LOC112281545 [Physcomitrium patens]PNR54798.1 hypothetical protein PHYPA_005691 [Physcomitrium patens]|eukprot:XP_024373964.1 uncharacterized protein LOC112281545 [Physcomitrella patens]
MATEGEHVDSAAEDLKNAAKEVEDKPQASETDGATSGDHKASEFIHDVAHIVLEKSNQAADSSKEYIHNVVTKVQGYADKVSSGAGGSASNMQGMLSKAVHVGAYPGSTTGTAGEGESSSGTDGGLFTSVATWCSSLCGSKDADGEPRNIDFRAAAENITHVLQSSTTSSSPSPYAVTPAETLPEPSEPEKPKASE